MKTEQDKNPTGAGTPKAEVVPMSQKARGPKKPEAPKTLMNLYHVPPPGAAYDAVNCPQCGTPKKGSKSRVPGEDLIYVCERCRQHNLKRIPKQNVGIQARRFVVTRTTNERVDPGFPFFALVLWRVFAVLLFRISYRAKDKEFDQKRYYAHICILWRHWIVEY
jgi:hypothetical protein